MVPLSSRLQAVKGGRRADGIVSQVHRLLAEGVLKPGERLPSERALGDIFGVSRTAVREALIRLEREGLLEIRHGVGVFVSREPGQSLGNPLAGHLFLSAGELLGLLELRTALETEAAALAARRATDGELAALAATHRLLEEAVQRGAVGTDPDVRFHQLIAEATHNPTFRLVFTAIQDGFRRGVELARRRSRQFADRPQEVLAEHGRILAALRQRTPEGARRAMREHLEGVRRRLTDAAGRAPA